MSTKPDATSDSDDRQPLPPSLTPLAVDAAVRSPSERVPTGSSVLDEGAIEEYGRTYHHYKADSYMMPNDGDEQNRLDLQHHVAFLLMNGDLAWAPIDEQPVRPRRALDLGTGTGIWAIQFAKRNPDCEVTASDLSSIQPQNVVPNVEFVREEADDEWTYNHTFDYIHARFFCSFVADFKGVLTKAYSHLEPGGWIELQELAICAETIWGGDNNSALSIVLTTMADVMKASGRDPFAMYRLPQLLREVGFVDVEEKVQPLPIGDWPEDPKYKQVGKWNSINARHGMQSFIKYIVASGRSETEVQELILRAQAEIWSNRQFGFGSFHVAIGRKPAI